MESYQIQHITEVHQNIPSFFGCGGSFALPQRRPWRSGDACVWTTIGTRSPIPITHACFNIYSRRTRVTTQLVSSPISLQKGIKSNISTKSLLQYPTLILPNKCAYLNHFILYLGEHVLAV